jgi:hypothetical protein
MKGRIAILRHEADRGLPAGSYLVDAVARQWALAGWEVVDLYGTTAHVPADLLFVHVDLSEVPEPYLEFASRYPRTVNGRVRDIRKSAFSAHLLRPGDPWPGPVIVKSDRNYGGFPEALRGVPRPEGLGLAPAFRSPDEYRIFRGLGDVPAACFEQPDVVVQAFLPEEEDDLYHVRAYTFFGGVHTSTRIASEDPIVKSTNRVATATVPPHPAIVAWRQRLGFDYGKFDYVVRGGEALLLDVNKTPGLPRPGSPRAQALAQRFASALEDYLAGPSHPSLEGRPAAP